MNQNWLLISVFYSALGMGFFIYGKKQSRPVPLVVGIIFLAITFFVYDVRALLVIGLGLVVLAWILRDK